MWPISSRVLKNSVFVSKRKRFSSAFFAPGVDAQQHVLRLAVLLAQVVDVVRRDERDAGALVQPHHGLVGRVLDPRSGRCAAARARSARGRTGVAQFTGQLLGLRLLATDEEQLVELPGQAAREAVDSLRRAGTSSSLSIRGRKW